MSTVKDIDNLLEGFLKRGIPGCSLHVVRKGQTLYEGYFGVKDINTNEPVTKDTLFRQASMSKIPLYTAMMILYEKGKYLMTDPVSDYLPEWKNCRKYVKESDGSVKVVPTERPMLIKDVMMMKCGLPYCHSAAPTDDPVLAGMQECMKSLWDKGHYTLQEHVRAISQAPLACEPGQQWIYGFSSEITAALAEVICDKPINDVLKELLYDPLEMNSTGAIYFGNVKERMAGLYAKQADGSWGNGPEFFDLKHNPGKEYEAGWGRIFSNGEDFSKLMQMLACGGEYNGVKIMGRKTIDLMRSNTLYPDGFGGDYESGYGYGYGVRTLINKAKGNNNGSLGAFGWTGGFGTWCEADPEEGLSIVYMQNTMPTDEQYCHPRVRQVSYGLL